MPPDKDGTRLVWVAISALGVILLAYFAWLGTSVTGLQQQMASLTTEVHIALEQKR